MSPCVRRFRKIHVQEKENRYELDKTLVSKKKQIKKNIKISGFPRAL